MGRCCGCNKEHGVCKNCECVKKGQKCVNCLPKQEGKCANTEPSVKAANTDKRKTVDSLPGNQSFTDTKPTSANSTEGDYNDYNN